MSWTNRVVWTEGMFLRTQHFQQSDRYHEHLVIEALKAGSAYYWGAEQLKLDEHLLKEGRVGIVRARGVFPDGTLFDVPEADDPPAPLAVPTDFRDTTIYLCTPIRREGSVEVALDGDKTARRLSGVEVNVPDVAAEGAAYTPVSIAKLNLSLMSDGGDLSGFESVPLCRVVERKSDGSVSLDAGFIPSVTSCSGSDVLSAILGEVRGLLHQRGEAIAARLGSASAGGVAEVTDFLLLQTVNRNECVFRHLSSMPRLHPERLYGDMAALAGELATFTEESNRPQEFPPYRQRNLTESFAPLINAIRSSLSAVFEQTAIAIPLEARGYGIRVGKIVDKTLLEGATFVLAAKAAVDSEVLRANLPKRTTIGAVERIRDLVNSQLTGAPIRPLSAEPRQIPYRAGVVYFGIGDTHQEWRALATSGGVAIHVSGDIPELDLALWAIRGRR